MKKVLGLRELGKRVIVFAPHPDDETFGCGGTIAKRVSEGYEVLVVVMTDGRYAFLNVLGISSDPSPEEVRKMRKEEVKKATRILGIPESNLIFLDFIDGSLAGNEREAEEKVIEILSKNCPDEVYFPYKRDGHPDHRAAYRIVKNSIRKLGISPIEYQYSITHKYARFGPVIEAFFNLLKTNRVYTNVSELLPVKELAIKEFKSEITAVSARQHKPVINSIKKFLKKKEMFYAGK